MFLALILVTVFFAATAVPVAGDDSLKTLPRIFTMQQVLVFLKELMEEMKDTQQASYRLHKRGAGEEEDLELVKASLIAKMIRKRLTMDRRFHRNNYLSSKGQFGPAYLILGCITSNFGK